jgi:hypothetical protein
MTVNVYWRADMRMPRWAAVVAALAVSGCAPRPPATTVLTGPQAAAIADSVGAFADSVARGVTRDGPGAWRRYFADTAAFFMASEGQLVFPNSDSATRGIAGLPQFIAHLELRWNGGVRVDALAPGLAMMAAPYHEVRVDPAGHRVEESGYFTGLVEHRPGGWQFRDAHWSVLTPGPAVR